MQRIIILFILFCFVEVAMGEEDPIAGEQHNIFVGASIGFDFPTFQTTPLTIGYYVLDNVSLGIVIGNHREIETNDEEGYATVAEAIIKPFFERGDTYLKTEGTYSNYGVHLRIFPGRTFNFSFAYYQREYDAKTTGIRNDSPEYYGHLNAKASVYTIGIGNHWLTDYGFYIGGDWFLNHILESSSVSVTQSRGVSIDYWSSRAEDFGEYINSTWSAHFGLLVLTVGYAF